MMMEWDPEWMLVQPSTAVILCNFLKKNKLSAPKSLKYMEFSGELLTQEVRELTQEVFGCVVANQYGCNEVNSIAFECPNGSMHILNTNVFIEIVDEYGELICDSSDYTDNNSLEGRIIITSLHNNAMPFIRYDIGDKGKLKANNQCSCGCKGKIIELTTGRNNDYVRFKNGEYTSSYIFVKIFDKINIYTDGAVIQFYVEQTDYDEFYIMLCIDDEFEENQVIRVFYDCIEEEHLMSSKFNFEFSDKLFDVRGSGKYMYFKSKVD